MIRVVVKLFATLREGRFSVSTLELHPGTTVADVVRHLGIPEEEAALIFVNSRHLAPSAELVDGDSLSIFPPIGGG